MEEAGEAVVPATVAVLVATVAAVVGAERMEVAATAAIGALM